MAQEHFVTAAVMRVLTRCFDELEEGDGPVVMMGLPPGSRQSWDCSASPYAPGSVASRWSTSGPTFR